MRRLASSAICSPSRLELLGYTKFRFSGGELTTTRAVSPTMRASRMAPSISRVSVTTMASGELRSTWATVVVAAVYPPSGANDEAAASPSIGIGPPSPVAITSALSPATSSWCP